MAPHKGHPPSTKAVAIRLLQFVREGGTLEEIEAELIALGVPGSENFAANLREAIRAQAIQTRPAKLVTPPHLHRTYQSPPPRLRTKVPPDGT